MRVIDRANLSSSQLQTIQNDFQNLRSLQDLLGWAEKQPEEMIIPGLIADLIVQDEYTHDLIVPWREHVLVIGTTWLGTVTAVAVWDHVPTADEILEARLSEGWKPTPSLLKEGEEILGHAACLAGRTQH